MSPSKGSGPQSLCYLPETNISFMSISPGRLGTAILCAITRGGNGERTNGYQASVMVLKGSSEDHLPEKQPVHSGPLGKQCLEHCLFSLVAAQQMVLESYSHPLALLRKVTNTLNISYHPGGCCC